MINTVMKFIGQYDTYRDMQKRAERKVGNVALCYTKNIELILSPNDYVEKEIQVGDVLELITEDKQ